MIRKLLFLLLIAPSVSFSHDLSVTPLFLGQYQIALPTNDVATYGLLNNTLSARYNDGSLVSVSIVPRSEFETPEADTAAKFLHMTFGNSAQLSERDGMVIYRLNIGERQSAYVVHQDQPDYYINIEAQKRAMEPILESFTRR